MPTPITMPQQSDTMTEGTVVKWLKKEGDKIKAGEIIAEIETDKATMEMEAFDSGTLAVILVGPGQKAPVGAPIAAMATSKETVDDVKKQYASGTGAKPQPAPAAPTAKPAQTAAPAPQSLAVSRPTRTPPTKPTTYHYDIIVIGGGPAGYAAAIRAGQLKQRVLCIEKENLGGTCLNWGCIPTKALLEDGAFVRRLRTESAERGVTITDMKVDFSKIVARSRAIADKLAKGIGHLFKKYLVQHVMGVGQVLGAHKVKVTSREGAKEYTAQHIIVAVGAKPTELPFARFDGKQIITSREAMNLPKQPKRIAIIGAGAIGCEFADFYNALGTEVTVVEMLPHLLPNEDEDVSILLERIFAKRGVKVHLKTKTDKIDKTADGVKLTLSGEKAGTVDADVVLVAVGVVANTDGLVGPGAGLELDRGRVKVDQIYKTNLEDVWAVGDCIAMHFPEQMAMGSYRHPDLAHVAHHEAVHLVDRIAGLHDDMIDYRNIPACTYTHPQVASMGATEKKLREQGRQIKIGKFPFSASGRALAAGESDGFVKLIFDAQYGELLGAHMIGENVTELLAELVLARKLEATEAEIIDAMHPHPTMSEAVMEAAGVADGRAIHL
ncbi:MAG: dihydrolipoamide dehydrogenase [Phycisphaerales bacterium]|nr:dihydrolipoamide dehydrogenase [Phycisphaerales bacterium]